MGSVQVPADDVVDAVAVLDGLVPAVRGVRVPGVVVVAAPHAATVTLASLG
jgi:hypothetical protein